MRSSMAVETCSCMGISGKYAFAVNTAVIGGLFFAVTGTTRRLSKPGRVGNGLDGMAVRAAQNSVSRFVKTVFCDVNTEGLSLCHRSKAWVVVAGQTIAVCDLHGRCLYGQGSDTDKREQ